MKPAQGNGGLFFSKIIDSLQDGLSILDPTLTIVWVNNVVKSWFPPELSLEGKKCHEIYYHQDRPCKICPALICLKSGRMARVIVPGFNKSCPPWLEITCFPLEEEKAPFPVGVVKFMRDISTLKRLELAKQESEAKLKKFFEWASDGIFILDNDNCLTMVNKKCLEIWGLKSKQKVIKKSFFEFVAHSDIDLLKRFFREALKRGPAAGIEFRGCRADDSEFSAEIDASMVQGDSGQPIGIIGIIRDITSRKASEQELSRYRHELEKIVEERTSQLVRINSQLQREINEHKKMARLLSLSEQKLQRQKKILERKNMALRELISQVGLEKENIKNDIAINIRKVIYPVLDLFKKEKATPKMLALLMYHLERIADSYGRKIYGPELKLTPKEIEICHFVCAGMASKDISAMLHISARTVEKHRRNIRRKLGLSRQHINLTTYLRQL